MSKSLQDVCHKFSIKKGELDTWACACGTETGCINLYTHLKLQHDVGTLTCDAAIIKSVYFECGVVKIIEGRESDLSNALWKTP